MIEVFARRTNSPRAAAFVAELQAKGKHAREGNAAWFDPAQIDPTVERVYHDGEVAAIPVTYEPLGIPCEIIPGVVPETDPAPRPPSGLRVENTSPGWWKVLDADGEQHGPAKRTPEEAEALRERCEGGTD